MELYNSIIRDTEDKLSGISKVRYAYDEKKSWPATKDFELVMAREGAYELGGSAKTAIGFSCVTSSPELVGEDAIFVCGPDLSEIKSDSVFARITFLRVGDIESDDENNTDEAFRAIQDIDFVRYRVYPKGYMMRTSSESGREQVRVSKNALREGLTFERLGNLFLKNYKQNSNVLNVKMFFVTDPAFDYSQAAKAAKTVHDITMSLSQILKGLPTDCGSCNLKDICDEVEGMKELHFGKNASK